MADILTFQGYKRQKVRTERLKGQEEGSRQTAGFCSSEGLGTEKAWGSLPEKVWNPGPKLADQGFHYLFTGWFVP